MDFWSISQTLHTTHQLVRHLVSSWSRDLQAIDLKAIVLNPLNPLNPLRPLQIRYVADSLTVLHSQEAVRCKHVSTVTVLANVGRILVLQSHRGPKHQKI